MVRGGSGGGAGVGWGLPVHQNKNNVNGGYVQVLIINNYRA